MTSTTRKSSSARARQTRRADIEVIQRGPTAEQMLIGSVVVLCLLGLIMVYSASSVSSVQDGGASWAKVSRQFMWMVGGLTIGYGASRIPLATWRDKLTTPLLVLAVSFQGYLAFAALAEKVAGVDLPMAITVKGATRWIGFGPFSGQPSDLVKLALILWLAKFLDDRRRQIGSIEVLKPILVVTGTLCLFVIAGDDLGTTLLLGAIMLTMLTLAGTPMRQVGSIAAAGGLLALLTIVLGEGFRLKRIGAFLHPDENTATTGYQLLQSRIGLASGGVFGSGPGNSRAKYGYLPEADNDFILAIIGEELGLIGSLVVLGAFLVFMFAGVWIGLRCRSRFGRLVAFGITTWVGVQALINIGVTVGALPTKGITLPFVSYGGSSLLMCMLAVGVMSSVAREAR
ncbi:MAG TPA: putative lipid II flippase FtsW [Microthrixaceae bacterium]|nr:putative lipid II flippase FtsW [Microthrixaceae bacterium]